MDFWKPCRDLVSLIKDKNKLLTFYFIECLNFKSFYNQISKLTSGFDLRIDSVCHCLIPCQVKVG